MSPEMELLDQLCGQDEDLSLALQLFGWPDNLAALERARHSIIEQVNDGLICIKQRAGGSDRVLPEWEARQIISDDSNWLKLKRGARILYKLD